VFAMASFARFLNGPSDLELASARSDECAHDSMAPDAACMYKNMHAIAKAGIQTQRDICKGPWFNARSREPRCVRNCHHEHDRPGQRTVLPKTRNSIAY
jgi:hypothetical protein